MDKVLREYEVDVTMSIPMGRTATITAICGYPVGTVPLGYARFNGAGYGMSIIALANAEQLILIIMSAWDTIVLFPTAAHLHRSWTKMRLRSYKSARWILIPRTQKV